jgi:hypothetical protein
MLHDLSYQHWTGTHVSLWVRRAAIARNGLTACLQNKWVRHLIALCWIAALTMAALLFVVGQLLVPDSFIVQWVATFNPQLQALVRALTTWLAEHPEISVRTSQNLLFYYFFIYLTPMSIFALGLVMPLLITRDLASNAAIIYSSKAVSRGDYLLGKFSTAFGLLTLTWLGPVCAAWFTGNLMAPDWKFFWHSRAVLGHAVICALSGMTVLSLLALGVSSLAKKEKSTPAVWFMWWIVGGMLAPIAKNTEPALRHLSFNYNLDQIAIALFRPGNDLQTARENSPVFGDLLRGIRPDTLAALNTPSIWGAVLALLIVLAAAAAIVNQRVKPE